MADRVEQAEPWKVIPVDKLSKEWDRLEKYYAEQAEAAPGAGYGKGSHTGKSIGFSVCAAQLRAALALPAEPPQLVEAIVREIEGEPFSTREELWDLVSKAVERIEMWTAEEVKEEFNGHVNYKGVIEISCASLADELNRIAVSLTPAGRSQAKRIAAQRSRVRQRPAPSERDFTLPELNFSALSAGIASPYWNALEKQLAKALLEGITAMQANKPENPSLTP